MGHSERKGRQNRLDSLVWWAVCDRQGKGLPPDPASGGGGGVLQRMKSAVPWTDMLVYPMSNSGQNIYLKNEKYLCLERHVSGRQRWKVFNHFSSDALLRSYKISYILHLRDNQRHRYLCCWILLTLQPSWFWSESFLLSKCKGFMASSNISMDYCGANPKERNLNWQITVVLFFSKSALTSFLRRKLKHLVSFWETALVFDLNLKKKKIY